LKPGDFDRRRAGARLRGLSFLSDYAMRDACWSACAAEVSYMFFHLATRSRQGAFTRQARSLAHRASARWLAGNARVPARTPGDELLLGYAYGAYTATRVGLDTRALRRDLAARASSLRARELFDFDPRREPPPAPDAWMSAMVATHIAEGVGMRLRWTLRDTARWRNAMQPYPRPRRRLSPAGWDAFYAVTHLVYVLNDYSLHLLPGERFAPEVQFLRAGCEVAIRDGDVEGMGEALDALLALGAPDDDPLLVRARAAILPLQNRDGSWGTRDDEPYTRLHKTWVALDGLTRYGRREVVAPPG
jgi:hypothetical protein